jgi:heptosyltransferase-2
MQLDASKIKKILIIHYGAIGDFIAGTVAFKAIRSYFNNAHITLLSKANTLEICPPNSIVDEYLVYDKKNLWKIFWQIRRSKFDIVINLKDFSEIFHIITFFSGIKIRAGLGRGIWSKVYTHLPPNYLDTNQHEYLKNLSVAETLGAKNSDVEAYVHIDSENKKETEKFLQENGLIGANILAIAPGASDFRKAWRAERFIELIKRFFEKYQDKIILTWGSEAEKKLVESIFHNVQNKNLYILPRMRIGSLAAILQNVKLLLCNNSGVMHVAYAVKTPVLCINTSISWQAFGKKGYNINAFGEDIKNNKYLPIDEVRILLDTISVEDVWQTFQQVWEKETSLN